MPGSLDPYKILGLGHDASLEEIRQAYRRAATKYHPDAGGDAWAFQQVQQAYHELRALHERSQAQRSDSASTPQQPARSPASSKRTKNESAAPHQANTATKSGKTSETPSNKKTPSVAWRDWLFGKPLRLHNETSYFILANFMDLVMTGILLRYSAVEANPLANYFYLRFGFIGMVGLKLASVVLVCYVAQSIAKRSEVKAKILLVGGTLFVAAVVVYSMLLARSQLP